MALWITGNHFSDHSSNNFSGVLYTSRLVIKFSSSSFKSCGGIDKNFLLFLYILRSYIFGRSIVLVVFPESCVCSFVPWKMLEYAYWSLVHDDWIIAKISNVAQDSFFFFFLNLVIYYSHWRESYWLCTLSNKGDLSLSGKRAGVWMLSFHGASGSLFVIVNFPLTCLLTHGGFISLLLNRDTSLSFDIYIGKA